MLIIIDKLQLQFIRKIRLKSMNIIREIKNEKLKQAPKNIDVVVPRPGTQVISF